MIASKRRRPSRDFFTLVLLFWFAVPQPGGSASANGGGAPGPLDQWELYPIDSAMGWTPIFLTAADLNGDGRLDLVSGGWWYENPGSIEGQWVKRTVGGDLNNIGWVDDVDGDGDLDLIGTNGKPLGGRLRWAENNGSGGFTVYTNMDFGQDTFFQGAIGGIFTPGGSYLYVMQWEDGEFGRNAVEAWDPPADLRTGTWTKRIINARSLGEQMSDADLDGDGDLDLFQGSGWLRNDRENGWVHFPVATFPPGKGGADRNRLADIDNDGDLDAVVGLSHFDGDSTIFVWLEHPSDPTQPWPQHLIVDGKWGGHSVDVADIDFDGDVDVVLGEHRGNRRAFIYENVNDGSMWVEHVLDAGAPGRDHHNGTLLFDLDGDGDLDIASIGWDNHKVWIFKNTAPYVPDAEAPSIPTQVVASVVTSSQVDLSWAASTDNRFVHQYIVFRDGVRVATLPRRQRVFTDRNLVPETEYAYTVAAEDSTGNRSELSTVALARTPPLDTEAPTIPGAPWGAGLSSSHIAVRWGASMDDVQVSRYWVFRGGTPVGTAEGTSFLDSGLKAGTSYEYRVVAVDSSGNESAPTDPVEVATLAGPVPPQQGLGLWLRADAGVAADAAGVSQWMDQSGNNRHAAQPVNPHRPALREVAGFQVVRMDGIDDFLSFQMPINGLSGMSIFLVAANTQNQDGGASGAERAALFWNETEFWGAVYVSPFQSSVNFRFGTTQQLNWPSYRRLTSLGSRFSLTAAIKDGTTDSSYVDGLLALREGGKLAVIAGCRDSADLGRGYNDNTFFAGDIAELLVFSRTVTTEERQTIEDYLGGRYALAVALAPQILAQPANLRVNPGENAMFTVEAVGTAPVSYQWRRNGIDVPGATAARYAIAPANSSDDGDQFDVVLRNPAGTVTSARAVLRVGAAAPDLVLRIEPAQGGAVRILVSGPPGTSFGLERSMDLDSWAEVLSATLPDQSPAEWIGTLAAGGEGGFFRCLAQE